MSAPIERPTSMNSPSGLHFGNLSRMCFAIAFGLWLCGFGSAAATSVAEVALVDLVARSEFIFEGKVSHIETRKDANSRHVWTRVTFDVVDVIKGASHPRSVALDFLGGTYGGKTLRVTDMVLPMAQERGVYFVESQTRRQVHPLYGWAQGHFIVVRDSDGTDRVTTIGAQPVLDLDRGDITRNRKRLSAGIARGVVTQRSSALSEAMSLQDFKRRLADIVAKP